MKLAIKATLFSLLILAVFFISGFKIPIGGGYYINLYHAYTGFCLGSALDIQVCLYPNKFELIEDSQGIFFKNVAGSNNHYHTDNKNAFYNSKKIYGADISSFRALAHNYAQDRYFVYFENKQIVSADINTFQLLNKEGYSWAKDRYHVFYKSYIVEGADALTFQSIRWPDRQLFFGYNRDKNQVYFGSTIVHGVDVNSFVPITISYLKGGSARNNKYIVIPYAQDRKNTFYKDTLIPLADLSTFEIVDDSDVNNLHEFRFAKDKIHVFYQGTMIDGADSASFKPVSWSRYEDENKTYTIERKTLNDFILTVSPK